MPHACGAGLLRLPPVGTGVACSLARVGEEVHRNASGLPFADRCLVEPDGVPQLSPAASPLDLAVLTPPPKWLCPASSPRRPGSPGRSPPCGAPQVGKVVHIACGDARDPRLSSVLSPRVRGHLRGFLPRLRSPRPLAARRRGLRSLSSGIPCRAASPRGALSCVMASPAALLVPAEAGSNPLAGTAARCGRSSARRLLLRRAVCRSHASSRASPRVGPGRGRARVAGLPPPARHRPGRAMVGRRRLSGSVGRTEVRRRVPQRPGVPAC
jgi:hypothetical protein